MGAHIPPIQPIPQAQDSRQRRRVLNFAEHPSKVRHEGKLAALVSIAFVVVQALVIGACAAMGYLD